MQTGDLSARTALRCFSTLGLDGANDYRRVKFTTLHSTICDIAPCSPFSIFHHHATYATHGPQRKQLLAYFFTQCKWHCMKNYASSCGRAACTTDQMTSEACENMRNEVTSKKKAECTAERTDKIFYCINKY